LKLRPPPRFAFKASSFRWQIAVLVSAAIAISYLDRQTLPVAIKAVQKDIPISNEHFSLLNTAFLVTYGLMYAVGGKLLDVLGTRLGFTLCMLFWSVACASHGFAASVVMLAASRLLLGAGEGGGFPAATKAVAEWFPVTERSSAMGIINAGTAIGAVAAPPLIALVLGYTNWRWIFFLTGALGLLWVIVWRIFYFVPEESRTEPVTADLRSNKSGIGLPHSKTSRSQRRARNRASVVECGCPLPLF
jgi:ACS family hexuronate transporter-like MFS transporter